MSAVSPSPTASDTIAWVRVSSCYLPLATGEMLTSVAEHDELIRHRAADYLMPDAPRVGFDAAD